MIEIWEDVKGYEGLYKVSNLGRVAKENKDVNKKMEILKIDTHNTDGYAYIRLSDGKTPKLKRLHKIVLMAFCPADTGSYYDKKYTVNHKDGNKMNNRLDNLEWNSQSKNNKHAYDNGLKRPAGKKRKVKCLNTGVIYESISAASRDIDSKYITPISRVCKHERKAYKGLVFEYLN